MVKDTMKNSENKLLRDAYKRTATSILTFTGVGFGYVILVEVLNYVSPAKSVFDPSFVLSLKISFVFIGLTLFLLSRYVGLRILTGSIKIPTSSIKLIKQYPEHIQRLVISTIVTHAFFDVIALLGLILFFVSRMPNDFYALFGGSLALSIINFPKYTDWEKWDRENQKHAKSEA